MAAALECWSARPSTDEDMVEQVLMKTHDRSEAFPASPPSSAAPPGRWHRIGRNFAGAFSALRSSLTSEQRPSAAVADKPLWGAVVRDLTRLYPGSQLPERLVSGVRHLFDSLPASYAQAGHDVREILLHVRLVEQATAEDHPAVHVEEARDLPSPDGSLFRLTFASAAPVSWPSLSGALDATPSISCKKIQIYERRGLTLGVVTLLVRPGSESLFPARVEAAVRSAVRPRPKTGGGVKLHLGFCGCQDGDGEMKDTCPSPTPTLTLTPTAAMVISVDERQWIRSGVEDAGRWLVRSSEIEIVDRVGARSFRGVYRGREVWVKSVRGCERGSAYEIEVRRDLLELMSRGHGHVLRLHGLCLEEAQGLCVVAAFMEAGSLHDALRSGGQMPAADVLRISLAVAEGLMFLNDHGVAFRGLNARRILLDDRGRACLGDMGVVAVRRSPADATQYETAGYQWLAPEIIAGDPETVTETWMSNVYSLGMVIWEMVTGEVAYGSYSPVQAAVGIAACGLRPEIPNDCPQVLRSLMGKCWNSNPCKRPRLTEVVALLAKHSSR